MRLVPVLLLVVSVWLASGHRKHRFRRSNECTYDDYNRGRSLEEWFTGDDTKQLLFRSIDCMRHLSDRNALQTARNNGDIQKNRLEVLKTREKVAGNTRLLQQNRAKLNEISVQILKNDEQVEAVGDAVEGNRQLLDTSLKLQSHSIKLLDRNGKRIEAVGDQIEGNRQLLSSSIKLLGSGLKVLDQTYSLVGTNVNLTIFNQRLIRENTELVEQTRLEIHDALLAINDRLSEAITAISQLERKLDTHFADQTFKQRLNILLTRQKAYYENPSPLNSQYLANQCNSQDPLALLSGLKEQVESGYIMTMGASFEYRKVEFEALLQMLAESTSEATIAGGTCMFMTINASLVQPTDIRQYSDRAAEALDAIVEASQTVKWNVTLFNTTVAPKIDALILQMRESTTMNEDAFLNAVANITNSYYISGGLAVALISSSNGQPYYRGILRRQLRPFRFTRDTTWHELIFFEYMNKETDAMCNAAFEPSPDYCAMLETEVDRLQFAVDVFTEKCSDFGLIARLNAQVLTVPEWPLWKRVAKFCDQWMHIDIIP